MASIKSLKDSNQSWILLKTSWSLEMSWKKWEYCTSLLLGNSYTFKKVDKTFHLKAYFSFHSSNFLFIIISPTCSEEYTGETGIGKTKLRYCVGAYRQHIRQPKHIRQPDYKKPKLEEHLKSFLYLSFTFFPRYL